MNHHLHQKNIIEYYSRTKRDYKIFWHGRNNKAMHLGYYDKEVKNHIDSLQNMNKILATKAGIKDGDLILDAGCGQGNSALWLAKNYGKISVTGITLVPHQVEIAKKQSIKYGLDEKLVFETGDYCNTKYPDSSFTVVWACESLCHATDKALFYKEAYRVLKPGGRIIVADPIRSSRTLDEKNELELRKCLQGFYLPDLDTYGEHTTNLSLVGFSDIKLENVTEYVLPSLKRLASVSRKLYLPARLLRSLYVLNRYNYMNLISSIAQYRAAKEKLWYYGIITAVKI